MRIAYFTHSLASCWNHGNAHFLRGLLRELIALGHEVDAYEGAWSLENLLRDHGEAGLDAYRAAYPDLASTTYATIDAVADRVAQADLVIVHEWNDPALAAALGARRKSGAGYTLLFHDTHHRAVSAPDEMRRFDLSGFDGILAFGETLAAVYRNWGWGDRAFVWHEAADAGGPARRARLDRELGRRRAQPGTRDLPVRAGPSRRARTRRLRRALSRCGGPDPATSWRVL
jgi:spore maturation protein CgeB